MRMTTRMLGTSLIVMGLVMLSFPSGASAGTLTCCTTTNADQEGEFVPASDVSAILTFEKTTSGNEPPTSQFQLTVTNTSTVFPPPGSGFDITEIFFNNPANATVTTIPTGWAALGPEDVDNIGNYGDFQVGFAITGNNPNTDGLNPGESVTFVFTLPSGTFTADVQSAFVNALSTGTQTPVPFALHFQAGGGLTGDLSTFASVPEPSSVLLAGVGLVAVGLCRRKAKTKA